MLHEVIFGLLVPLYGLLTVVVLFVRDFLRDERDLRREREGGEAGR